jgi:hypothetical protein
VQNRGLTLICIALPADYVGHSTLADFGCFPHTIVPCGLALTITILRRAPFPVSGSSGHGGGDVVAFPEGDGRG